MSQNVMWNGTCQYLPFIDQVRATHLAGCEVLSMTPDHFLKLTDAGLTGADIQDLAAEQGVRVTHLDPLLTWVADPLASESQSRSEPTVPSVGQFLDIAGALGAESITAICTAPAASVEIDQFADSFAELCERADGLRVDLEFIPNWALPDLETAWKIVRDVDAPNGGIMLDFWHFFRGNPDFDILECVPANKIHSVQVCDAMLSPAPGRSALEDMLEDRMPLGAGEFDVDDLLRALGRKGALGVVGPEYYSKQLQGFTAERIAAVVEDTYWSRLSPLGVTPALR